MNGEKETKLEGTEQVTPEGGETKTADETVTLSKRELELRMNSEADKRVSQALKTHEEKIKAQLEERIRLEREEAEKLAKMKADEREKYEREKYEQALLEKEKAIADRELRLKTTEYLGRKGLPLDVMDFVIGKDETETQEKLEKLEALIGKRLEDEKTKWIQANSDTSLRTEARPKGGRKLTLDEIQKIPDREARLKALAEAGYE